MAESSTSTTPPVSLLTIAREWGRIGCIGFGGPPAHIALLRTLCVEQRGWLSATEFEDGIAATSLLPGPASTQLAIYCAWRLRGPVGALVGGACFIVPGLIVILALSALFLAARPPLWVRGAAAGAGAAVPAVAVAAAIGLAPASWRRMGGATARRMGGAAGPRAGGAAKRQVDGAAATGPAAAGWRRMGGAPARQAGGAAAIGPAAAGWRRMGAVRPRQVRWVAYLLAGGASAALIGPYLVVVLLGCGLIEMLLTARPAPGRAGSPPGRGAVLPLLAAPAAATGGLLAVAWVAAKVGALSFGGGFVIIPLMQHDAVHTYHWMTNAQFLSAVALGQVTPGPVVQTVAVVGFAAAGVGGGLLASLVAFAPSFAMVLAGGSRFDQLRRNVSAQAFLSGSGPAAIGAIAGATIPLGLSLAHLWQLGLLALAAVWLIALRRSVVVALVGAGALGVIAVLAGAPAG